MICVLKGNVKERDLTLFVFKLREHEDSGFDPAENIHHVPHVVR